jgi:hypothetical protein
MAPLPEFSVMEGRVNEFLAAVQHVLKKEWKRVKRGERTYRTVFVLSVLGAIGLR